MDNHADGAYLYLKLREEDPARAEEVLSLLRWTGGGLHSSGVGVADIDFLGNVHPDQFWMSHTLCNVRDREFSEIWPDTSDEILAATSLMKSAGSRLGAGFTSRCSSMRHRGRSD